MMKQYTLEEVLEEVCRRDFAEFDNPANHYFSIRHRCNMKRILSQKCEKFFSAKIKSTPKTAVIVLLIVFLALITGAIIVLRLPGFSGTVYPDNTQMFALDNSAPTTIEQIYYLEALSDNFILTESNGDIGDDHIECVYINQDSGNSLIFEQYTKNRYHAHFDNDYGEIFPMEIYGCNGFLRQSKISEHKYVTLVWDNGDYILSLWCNMYENDILDLAKSAKVLQN